MLAPRFVCKIENFIDKPHHTAGVKITDRLTIKTLLNSQITPVHSSEVTSLLSDGQLIQRVSSPPIGHLV